MIWRWLMATAPGGDLGTVHPWNVVISERHAAATERLLLGAAGAGAGGGEPDRGGP